MQRQLLSRQIAAFLASRVACPSCGRARGIKDHKTISFRTLFGRLELASPRLRRCPCQHTGQASTSPLVDLLAERTAPELLYLESKWASLVSYGLTVEALRDFLPVDTRLNATSVRRPSAGGIPPSHLGTNPLTTPHSLPDRPRFVMPSAYVRLRPALSNDQAQAQVAPRNSGSAVSVSRESR